MMSTRKQAAEFILREARAAGIRVGTDGTDIVLLAPLKISWDSRRTFEVAVDAHRQEIIDLIMAENAG
jgi:hypothetical protein